MEPDHSGMSRAWSWRHAVGKSGLPPITRLVLHTLGLKMDATGGSCYPPISELVDLTGLDKKTVLKHLEIAEESGWIVVTQHGFRGQKWKRNEYVARWPGRDLSGSAASNEDNEGGGNPPPRSDDARTPQGGGAVPPPSAEKVVEMVPEGGGNDDRKVVEELHQDKNLPTNIPENSPAAGAEEGVLKKADRKKIEHAFTLWYATWKKGDVEFARNAWFALSPEERTECVERTPAYLRWAKPADVMAAAVYLKNRHWRDLPEHALAEPVQTRGIAKVCGKLWMGTWFAALARGPDVAPRFTLADEQGIDAGRVTRDQLIREKRLAYGWSKISVMLDKARSKEDFVTSLDILPQVEAFRQIEYGGDLYCAWKRLHDRRGWPFVGKLRDWLWMPPVDEASDDLDSAVEVALSNFLSSINEGRTDDAA